MGVASRARWRHEAVARGGRVGKRQTAAQRNAGRNATDAQTANINLRSTPWWWNRRDGAPGYRRRVRNILAVSEFDYGERCPMTALGRSNEPVLPIWGDSPLPLDDDGLSILAVASRR